MDGEKINCKYIVERVDTFIDKDKQGRDLLFIVTDLYNQGDLEMFLMKNS